MHFWECCDGVCILTDVAADCHIVFKTQICCHGGHAGRHGTGSVELETMRSGYQNDRGKCHGSGGLPRLARMVAAFKVGYT